MSQSDSAVRPSGRKTAAASATAVGALAVVPFDLTGVALVTAVGSGTAAVGGLTHHASRNAVKSIKHRVGKQNANEAQTVSAENLKVELETSVRRLSSSATGIAVTGSMSVILPHYLLGVVFNAADLIVQANRLHKLADLAAAAGGVTQTISAGNIILQVVSGVLIKAAILVLTLGNDVDAVISGFSELSVSGLETVAPDHVPDVEPAKADTLQHYDRLVAHDPMSVTAPAAGQLPDAVANHLGYDNVPTWQDGPCKADVTQIALASEAVDLVVGRLIENPTHGFVNYVTRLSRRPRGRA